MWIRFIDDADLNYSSVAAPKRREPGVDFLTASAAGLEGLPGSGVLEVASRQGRALLTHDRKTMPHHFAEFIESRSSPGVFVISQSLPPAPAAEELLLIRSTTEAEEWEDRIVAFHSNAPLPIREPHAVFAEAAAGSFRK